MFALIAFTGGGGDAPLAASAPSVRPSASWWVEPVESGVALATVTETVVEGAGREVKAARVAAQERVVGSVVTVTSTVAVSGAKPAASGRNEPGELGEEPGEEEPVLSSEPEISPVVTTSSPVVSTVVSTVEAPVVTAPPSSTPRAEDPVVPPVEPPCDRAEPVSGEIVEGAPVS
ncbi:hypothetical protein GCM10017774_69550 [Lentzea cavernae]|uniref:G5 domain-containing protein n=1 Tax=Lentzea cavernae TaxID=2020703 RepID=A0ABQ3MRI2_9PSEU|nr:hypothetical protein GCM10017774_69550 [Lentzea cavernae]